MTDVIFQNGQGVSQSLADILAREWPMPDSRREKAVLVTDLIHLFEAVQATGWNEHTCDWDWRVYVTAKDGTIHGTIVHTDEDADTWADTIFLRIVGQEELMGAKELHDNIWTDPQGLEVVIETFGYQNMEEPQMVAVNLDEISVITYEEL